LPVKILPEYEIGGVSSIVHGLNYVKSLRAAGVNVKVTNNSWTTFWNYSQPTESAIRGHRDPNGDFNTNDAILFVAAAANDSKYMDDGNASYPAMYDSDNILCVASTDRNDDLAFDSNVSSVHVDMAAPGVSIYSTIRTINATPYGLMSGTSMAAPHVTGAAVLAWAAKSTATYTEVKAALMDGTDLNPATAGLTVTGGRLNARRSLDLIKAPLDVNGTDGDNTIEVRVNPNNTAQIQVQIGTDVTNHTRSNYTSVRVYGKGGIDGITINESVAPIGLPVWVDGGAGNDTITGASGAEKLLGGDGNDTITAGAGNDHIHGGPGADTLNGGANDDTLIGGENSSGFDALNGDSGNDRLAGDHGDDNLAGGFGNDTYSFPDPRPNEWLGADVVTESTDTEAGTDVLHFFNFYRSGFGVRTVDISVSGSRGGTTAFSDFRINLHLTAATGVENVRGTRLPDEIHGNSLGNVFWGYDEADTLFGAGGNDTLHGGAENDIFVSEPGSDTLNGNDGDDTMSNGTAADGADVFNGGAGTDVANYQERTTNLSVSLDSIANDGGTAEADNIKNDVETINAGPGNDSLSTSSAPVTIDGGPGNDIITGGPGIDTLRGGEGTDTIQGRGGNDIIHGGENDDTLYGDDPAYNTVGGGDTINGDGGNDTIVGGYGDDNLDGGDGDDWMYGDDNPPTSLAVCKDTMDGGPGADQLWGGYGDDIMTGGDGADILRGEYGNDSFKAADGVEDTLYGGHGNDKAKSPGDQDSSRDVGIINDVIPLADIEVLQDPP
jgi:Ca2+-binding RTX toxin-like protein